MAFAPRTFSTLRAYMPRAFIRVRSPVDLPTGQAGDLGSRAFAPAAFATTTFFARSLRGVSRPRLRRRMLQLPLWRWDARRGSGNRWG